MKTIKTADGCKLTVTNNHRIRMVDGTVRIVFGVNAGDSITGPDGKPALVVSVTDASQDERNKQRIDWCNAQVEKAARSANATWYTHDGHSEPDWEALSEDSKKLWRNVAISTLRSGFNVEDREQLEDLLQFL